MTQLLDRQFVQKRIGEGGSGISYAEFSYTLIQGYDFLHLFRTYNIDLQLCGADQFGNASTGIRLINKFENANADVWSTPLIIDPVTGKIPPRMVDINGDMLIVSQFTLYASCKKGNRPSYIHASKPDIAIPLYENFCQKMSAELGKQVKTGEFGANMQVELLNDGPVTISMDSKIKE